MYEVKNFIGESANDDIRVVDRQGCFQGIEYLRDLSVMPSEAGAAYFSGKMNIP